MSDNLFARLFEDMKTSILSEMKTDLDAMFEASFRKAWDGAMSRLSTSQSVATVPVAPKAVTHPQSKPRGFAAGANRAAWGATKEVIKGAFTSYGKAGMTVKQASDWGNANGHPIAASSVRTTLTKMHKAGECRRRKDKFFPLLTEAKSSVDAPTDKPASENVHPFTRTGTDL